MIIVHLYSFKFFLWDFSSDSRIFHSCEDVTITSTVKVMQSKRVTQCNTKTSVYNVQLREFRSGALTTCFYDSGLSRPGFEHPTIKFGVRGERSNRLCDRRDHIVCLFAVYLPTREFFTLFETWAFPVKDCKFWSMLGSHDHRAVRDL